MDNYEIARDRAREYFLTRDLAKLPPRPGVVQQGDCLCFRFLGCDTRVSLVSGEIRSSLPGMPEWSADFGEALSVYDWLCDAKPDARACGAFCTVNSLPGILMGGSSGLMIGTGTLPEQIDSHPEQFTAAMQVLGGKPFPVGDLGFTLEVFPGVPLLLKFYHADEDFPAQLTVLWDRNMLDFVKYETVYYIAGVLFRRLRSFLAS